MHHQSTPSSRQSASYSIYCPQYRRAILQKVHSGRERKSAEREAFLPELAKLSLPEQLKQLAYDKQRPVEWYPKCIAGAAQEDKIKESPEELRLALLY
jgi:hypothetical protein